MLNAALADTDLLTNILLFHAVDEEVFSEDLVCTGLVGMANGQDSRTVCHGPDGDGIFQKGGSNSRDMMPEVTTADVEACNGRSGMEIEYCNNSILSNCAFHC